MERWMVRWRAVMARGLVAPLLLYRQMVYGYAFRRIRLTQGKFARVDPADYPALAVHKWSAARQGRSIYAVRSEAARQLRMHRVIMKAPGHLVCDHIDHDGLNNTRGNLRLCTRAQNARNQRRRTGGTSRYKGVAWHKRDRKWHARICHRGRCHHLGAFVSEPGAARAYDRAAARLHGTFAHGNFARSGGGPKKKRPARRRGMPGGPADDRH